MNDKNLKELIEGAYQLLLGIGGREALNCEIDYYKRENLRSAFPTLLQVHVRMCDSIRNSGKMRLVINDNIFDAIKKRLINANLGNIARDKDVVKQLVANVTGLSSRELDKRSWKVFIDGAFCGAKWLLKFVNIDGLYGHLDAKSSQTVSAWSIVIDLDDIRGIGPAIACDFLKEIGMDNFGKPDVHVMDNVLGEKGVGWLPKNMKNREFRCFSIMRRMSELTQWSTAQVDKILWMGSSGRWDKTLDDKESNCYLGSGRVLPIPVRKRKFKDFLSEFIAEH
ncbi:MAG: hypothetical protein AB1597_07705 [Chloroflexota bacterium]